MVMFDSSCADVVRRFGCRLHRRFSGNCIRDRVSSVEGVALITLLPAEKLWWEQLGHEAASGDAAAVVRQLLQNDVL